MTDHAVQCSYCHLKHNFSDRVEHFHESGLIDLVCPSCGRIEGFKVDEMGEEK